MTESFACHRRRRAVNTTNSGHSGLRGAGRRCFGFNEHSAPQPSTMTLRPVSASQGLDPSRYVAHQNSITVLRSAENVKLLRSFEVPRHSEVTRRGELLQVGCYQVYFYVSSIFRDPVSDVPSADRMPCVPWRGMRSLLLAHFLAFV